MQKEKHEENKIKKTKKIDNIYIPQPNDKMDNQPIQRHKHTYIFQNHKHYTTGTIHGKC